MCKCKGQVLEARRSRKNCVSSFLTRGLAPVGGGPDTGVARELLGPDCGGVLVLMPDDMISSLISRPVLGSVMRMIFFCRFW